MRWLWIFVMVVLAGCNTPSGAFRGADAKTVTVDGATYKVFHAGGQAQALRVTASGRPNRGADTQIETAIQRATGCRVSGGLSGDVVMATARVACGGRAARGVVPEVAPGAAPPVDYQCDLGIAPDRAYCIPI